MLIITDVEVKKKISFHNPWWDTGKIEPPFDAMKPRAYIKPFLELLPVKDPHRAVVLMGPRRIGKTVMLYHSAKHLMDSGIPARDIVYFSLDDPIYFGIRLEKLLEYALGDRLKKSLQGVFVFFDEVQYLRNWEVHLKTLVDSYRGIKFVASGSAAAALRLKSDESGAGRFTDFLLPPLTFSEYLALVSKETIVKSNDIKELNNEFIKYINYGGFPEAALSPEIQANVQKYIGNDIIDKVLLRDLPSLYGIHDTQELNRLFTTLAYNSANEVSLDELSKNSGVAKQTVKRYVDYLEAAFLIKKLPRIDDSGKRFKREVNYKVYLTNPSMRCALFGPVDETSDKLGHQVETAIFAQMLHAPQGLDVYYARWKDGEVDFVFKKIGIIVSCIEVKWSDKVVSDIGQLKNQFHFMKKAGEKNLTVTTKTIYKKVAINDIDLMFAPSSLLCHVLGRSYLKEKFNLQNLSELKP